MRLSPASLSFLLSLQVGLLSVPVTSAQSTPPPASVPASGPASPQAPAAVRSPLLAGGQNIDVATVMKAALDGDVQAQRTMGDVFRLGIGGQINVDESMAWFRRAAAGGDDYSIGFVSAKADKLDESLAAYRRAADRGDAAAQAALGAWYFGAAGNAIRPTTDFAQSLMWFRRSADQGYFEGLFGLGGLYATGLGVTRDMVEAHKWCSLGLRLAGPIAITRYQRQTLDTIEGMMTAAQIAEARKRADAWGNRQAAPSGR